ncbi:hypothetical protein C5748_16270 [Phyllobacterium phragmitis]|uniref:Uncharacterized protein n=1 Tax=Phyllobacterium phragmitis TaxID=2670329 RepID=A0A2S9IP94_9HYPH|nr:hypothetical protein [Phyllobacterium phragmitis]PRD42348.1 hypothetical protein C5748_16270 [Phyllobacterium phragmitis]
MAKIIRKEIRKRGFLGWLFLLLFLGFNIFMAFGLFAGVQSAATGPVASDAEAAGRAIGAAIGGGFLLFVWVAGAVILGLFAVLFRGRKTLIEETVE